MNGKSSATRGGVHNDYDSSTFARFAGVEESGVRGVMSVPFAMTMDQDMAPRSVSVRCLFYNRRESTMTRNNFLRAASLLAALLLTGLSACSDIVDEPSQAFVPGEADTTQVSDTTLDGDTVGVVSLTGTGQTWQVD